MESYLTAPGMASSRINHVDTSDQSEQETTQFDNLIDVAATTASGSRLRELFRTMRKLLERMENLEARLNDRTEEADRLRGSWPTKQHKDYTKTPKQNQPVRCRRCRKEGHFAYGCAVRRTKQYQGNYKPLHTLARCARVTLPRPLILQTLQDVEYYYY